MGHINDKYSLIGDQAIQAALPLLRSIGTVEILETGSDMIKQLQDSGADLMLFTGNGSFKCIEVKGALKTYSTIHIETVQDTRTGSKGWIYNIESDFLLWIYIDTRVGYMLRVRPFKQWFDLHEWLYDRVEHKKNSGACSLGILVKWEDLYKYLGAKNFFKFNLNTNWDSGMRSLGIINN